MRTEYFEYLLGIKKYETIFNAAQNLYVSPQAVSMAITVLEKELGLQLVERNRKGSHLTPAGESIATAAEEFFAKVNAVRLHCTTAQISFSCHYPTIYTHGFLTDIPFMIEENLRTNYAKIHFKLEESLTYTKSIEQVANGSRQYSLIYQLVRDKKPLLPLQNDDLAFEPFISGQLYCYIHRKLLPNSPIRFSFDTLKTFPTALFIKDTNDPFTQFLFQIYSSANLYCTTELVQRNLAITNGRAIGFNWSPEGKTPLAQGDVLCFPVQDRCV